MRNQRTFLDNTSFGNPTNGDTKRMGNKQSKKDKAPLDLSARNDGKLYRLSIRPRGGCCPDVWHQNPAGAPYLALSHERKHFPRHNGLVKGYQYTDFQGKKWLVASHVQGSNKEWKEAPPGAALPLSYFESPED